MVRSRRFDVRRRGAAQRGAAAVPRPEVPGYLLGSPLGFGLGGPVWSAHALDGSALAPGAQCAVAVLTGADAAGAEQQRRRLAALVGARHDNLADVLEVVRVRGGCAVVSERVEGPTLAALRLARPPLTLGEVASLLGPLADAVAHLHRHGATHGDVSPANVVLTPKGAPVLVDLVGEVTTEGGTPGFAAPERGAGSPGPPGDVWSLAALALWLVGPADKEQVRSVLAPALAREPHARCSAAALALLAEGLGEPHPIAIPAPPSLAHGTLRARGALAETRPASRRRRVTSFGRGAGRHRAPRSGSGSRGFAVAVVAVLIVASGGLGAASVAPPRVVPERPAPANAGEGATRVGKAVAGEPDTDPSRGAEELRESPAPALVSVERLIRDRDLAVTTGDGAALLALSAPGSPARRSDAPVASALERGYRVEGLRTTVHRVSLLAEREGEVEIEVVTAQSEHLRVAPDGTVTEVAARGEECAVLVLTADGSPRLQDVTACLPASSEDDEGPPPRSR